MTALLAPACAVCNTTLERPTAGCVCGSCWRSVRLITPPICDRCGEPLSHAAAACSNGSRHSSAITRARAIGEYEGTLREVIHALKYAERVSLARPLAERMRERAKELIDDVDGVVPVPLHWRREYHRGFNQAYLIARHLGPRVVRALRRSRATRPQIELAADRRRANVAGAFRLRRPSFYGPDIEGKRLLLIDDVSTTGATLEACAHVLREGGASEVHALTAARVVTRRPQSRITNH